MSTATKNHENGSPISTAGNEGMGTANNHESSEEIYFCAHRFCGCVSQQGYRCLLGPECQPVDANGRRFVVREWIENGTRMTSKDYLDDVSGIPLKGARA